MENKIDVFKALGDANRVRILCMLNERDLCVCEINSILNVSMSTISAHLKTLKNAGLVNFRKEGRWIFYSLSLSDEITAELIKTAIKYVSTENLVEKDVAALEHISPANCSTAV